MEKKYDFTEETIQIAGGATLRRIKALRDFGYVKAGDLGGFIEKEENLSHEGNAWIYDNAWVCDNARVCDNAQVCDNARVYGNAQVYGYARVGDNARVYGNAWIYGDARVYSDAWIYGDADIADSSDYICFKGFGSENRNTTVFRCRDNHIRVKCGCFSGTLAEFAEKVKETHGDSKYAREYLACIEAAKIHFEE